MPFACLGTFWDTETKAKANLSWEAVAEHLRRTKKDAHLYCPLCNQGLVKSKGLTPHIHAFHAWALPALSAARDHSLVHRRGLALTSPCWYCAVPFKGHHTQHAAVCAEILHAKLVVLLHHPEVIEDGSGRSFEGRLARSRSGAPASADGGTAGGGLHGPHRLPAPPSTEVTPGQEDEEVHTPEWERTRSESGQGPPLSITKAEPTHSTTPVTATATATPERSKTPVPAAASQQPSRQLGLRVVSAQACATPAAARGLPERPSPEHNVGDVPGHSSPAQHNPSPDQRAMANQQGGAAGIHPTPYSPLSDLGLRTEVSCGSSCHGPSQAPGSSTTGSPHRGRHVPLQKVEPHPPGTGECIQHSPALVRLLEEVILLSTEESALINYHPTKKLLPEMTGPTVTFSLVLGLRDPKAYRLWTVIETLSGSAALMLGR